MDGWRGGWSGGLRGVVRQREGWREARGKGRGREHLCNIFNMHDARMEPCNVYQS